MCELVAGGGAPCHGTSIAVWRARGRVRPGGGASVVRGVAATVLAPEPNGSALHLSRVLSGLRPHQRWPHEVVSEAGRAIQPEECYGALRDSVEWTHAMPEQSNALPYPDEVFLSKPEVRGGVVWLAGTRVGVSQLLSYRDGYTIDEFLNDFPTVKEEQAQFALERIDNEYVRATERAAVGKAPQQ